MVSELETIVHLEQHTHFENLPQFCCAQMLRWKRSVTSFFPMLVGQLNQLATQGNMAFANVQGVPFLCFLGVCQTIGVWNCSALLILPQETFGWIIFVLWVWYCLSGPFGSLKLPYIILAQINSLRSSGSQLFQYTRRMTSIHLLHCEWILMPKWSLGCKWWDSVVA